MKETNNINMQFAEALKSTIITELREKQEGFLNPIIVNFQNGEINVDHAKNCKVLFKRNEVKGIEIHVESINGQIFKQVDVNNSNTKQYIAIRNKKTNKMKVIEVDSAVLINSALMPSKDLVDSSSVNDYNQNISKLNKTFGGKKITSRIEQREKLNVSSNLVGEEIKEIVEGMKNENEISSNQELESGSIFELLPPCNRKATKISDVYVLSEIINDEELEALKAELLEAGLNKNLPNDHIYSKLFDFCYKIIKEAEDKLNKLAAMLYAEALIKFLKTPIKQLNSKKSSFGSTIIQTKIFKEFCIKTGSSITRPLAMRDKLICYILAISLICCNYQINLKILASVTSTPLNKLVRLAKVVGAVPALKDSEMFILKLPLPELPRKSIAKSKRK